VFLHGQIKLSQAAGTAVVLLDLGVDTDDAFLSQTSKVASSPAAAAGTAAGTSTTGIKLGLLYLFLSFTLGMVLILMLVTCLQALLLLYSYLV